jgi:hypothetical protein
MGRKRRANEPPSYVPAPTVPEELNERLQTVMAVLAGTMTMSEGAAKLGMARNNFQTLVHRTQQAMVESLLPRPTGPKPKPEAQTELETEVDRLRRRNQKLESQLQTMDRLLGVAGEVITGLRESEKAPGRTSRSRSPHSSPSSTPPSTDSDEDEDPEPAALLAKVADVAERGLVARALGVSASTERRLRADVGAGAPMRRRRLPRPPPTPAAEAQVRALVRSLHGLAGAASLSRSVAGVSRRQAAAIKADELAAMERERRQACRRVTVTRPGIVRGFDGMHLPTTGADLYALIGSDACVPYRTSLVLVPSYDGPHVAETLDDDFRRHGAPLVCRRDRLAAQHTDEVDQVLEAHGVLTLRGPPRYPRFYGQTERQMREHRAWLAPLGLLAAGMLTSVCASMTSALNRRWRRRRLGWRTAEEVWMERPPVTDDRAKLRDEVLARAARLRSDGLDNDLAMRLAIEKALTDRGYLRVSERQ